MFLLLQKRYDPTEKQIKQFLGTQSEKSEEELEEEELRRVTAEKIIEALGENAWGAESAAAAVAFDRAVWVCSCFKLSWFVTTCCFRGLSLRIIFQITNIRSSSDSFCFVRSVF